MRETRTRKGWSDRTRGRTPEPRPPAAGEERKTARAGPGRCGVRCPPPARGRQRPPRSWVPAVLLAAFFTLPVVVPAGPPSSLSFDHPRMIDFDLSFKGYIKALKGKPNEKEALAALGAASRKWEALAGSVPSGGQRLRARMQAVRALLLLAESRLRMGQPSEALELSVPIRSELYLLHEEADTLTPEDRMIYFHNGLLHRAEPLIAEGRYAELEALIPRMEETLAGFETPPKGVGDAEAEYRGRYRALKEAFRAYAATIREVNRYVDPEFGAAMLRRRLEEAQLEVHRRLGALYLGFPTEGH